MHFVIVVAVPDVLVLMVLVLHVVLLVRMRVVVHGRVLLPVLVVPVADVVLVAVIPWSPSLSPSPSPPWCP